MRSKAQLTRASLGLGPKSRWFLATTAVVGTSLVGGISVASASATQGNRQAPRMPDTTKDAKDNHPEVDGKVVSVGSGAFSVLDISGKTYAVDVSGATTYAKAGAISATVNDVKVGAYVDVVGSVTGLVVNAASVRIETSESNVPCMRGSGVVPKVAGKITAVGAETFTVTDRSGSTVTVVVNGSTTYEEPGVVSAGFSEVKIGEFAAVTGSERGSAVAASDVHISTDAMGPGPRELGPGSVRLGQGLDSDAGSHP